MQGVLSTSKYHGTVASRVLKIVSCQKQQLWHGEKQGRIFIIDTRVPVLVPGIDIDTGTSMVLYSLTRDNRQAIADNIMDKIPSLSLHSSLDQSPNA